MKDIRELGRQMAIALSVSVSSVHHHHHPLLAATDFAAKAKKSCKKGVPCGGTCIAANRICRDKLGGAEKTLATKTKSISPPPPTTAPTTETKKRKTKSASSAPPPHPPEIGKRDIKNEGSEQITKLLLRLNKKTWWNRVMIGGMKKRLDTIADSLLAKTPPETISLSGGKILSAETGDKAISKGTKFTKVGNFGVISSETPEEQQKIYHISKDGTLTHMTDYKGSIQNRNRLLALSNAHMEGATDDLLGAAEKEWNMTWLKKPEHGQDQKTWDTMAKYLDVQNIKKFFSLQDEIDAGRYKGTVLLENEERYKELREE